MPPGLEVVGHAVDGLVELTEGSAVGGFVHDRSIQTIGVAADVAEDAAEEAVGALGSGVGPVHVFFGRSGEEFEDSAGVGAELGDHVVGADDVALGLGHLGAVADDHALREQARGGLVVGDEPQVAHHLGEEARVDQVEDRVFHAADVLIDGEPVGDFLGIKRRGVARR